MYWLANGLSQSYIMCGMDFETDIVVIIAVIGLRNLSLH